MSKFEMPKNIIIPKVRLAKAGEEVLSVAFDLGLDTGEPPLAIVFEKNEERTYIRKFLKDDDALELHKLLAE